MALSFSSDSPPVEPLVSERLSMHIVGPGGRGFAGGSGGIGAEAPWLRPQMLQRLGHLEP